MATYEVYVGGPPSGNYSRAMFPAVPFNAAGASFIAVKPSAHKGPATYNDTRIIDTKQHAMGEFLRNTTLVQGDVLGAVLIPQRVILQGLFFEVETPAGVALSITPAVRGLAGATFPVINGNAVASGFTKVGGTAWQTASGTLSDATDGTEFYMATPAILDLTLTTLTAPQKLGALRLNITPLFRTVSDGGQY